MVTEADEESKSFMKPMEMGNDTDLSNSQKKDALSKGRSRCSMIMRVVAIISMVAAVLFITLIVLPKDITPDTTELETSSIRKELKPEIVKYSYEPKKWCLNSGEQGQDEDRCKELCYNPLAPKVPIHNMVKWYGIYEKNKQSAENAPDNLDVVFVGDSIIEKFNGYDFGEVDKDAAEITPIFKKYFSLEGGGSFEGHALGIANDQTSNLLWRIQHEELADLNPKVWWLETGTNNFMGNKVTCSDEVVTRGVIRIVEEIRELRPESKIVINGLFPRADKSISGRLYWKPRKSSEDYSNIWEGIELVNSDLKKYCEENVNLFYVDSSKIFIKENPEFGDGQDAKYIPNDLMEDHFHPTPTGYRYWAESVNETLHELIP